MRKIWLLASLLVIYQEAVMSSDQDHFKDKFLTYMQNPRNVREVPEFFITDIEDDGSLVGTESSQEDTDSQSYFPNKALKIIEVDNENDVLSYEEIED